MYYDGFNSSAELRARLFHMVASFLTYNPGAMSNVCRRISSLRKHTPLAEIKSWRLTKALVISISVNGISAFPAFLIVPGFDRR